MFTRLSFLQSAVFLPSLFAAHALAQDTRNNAVSFADFENPGGFTAGQIAVLRRKAEQWKAQAPKR